MSLFDAFSYKGKRALIVGGATGMGAAVAEVVRDAGAEVVVMDRAEIAIDGATGIHLDLSDAASIDEAVDKCGGPVDAVFACAGVADDTPGIERINFIGHRRLIDRMIAADMIPRGSALGFISSFAGVGWENDLPQLQEFLDITDFEEAAKWARDHDKATYVWSKEAINAYVAREAFPMLKRGIRVNAIMPGPTVTPLAEANRDTWLAFAADYRAETGVEASSPVEQAYPLVYLCSDAARSVTGITMITDMGYASSGLTGSFEAAQPIVNFMMGRGT